MVIVHLSGGFGNQLFSYAFGYAVAKERKEELCIDTAIQDMEWFFRNPDILKMNISFAKRVSYPIKRTLFDRAILNKIRFRKSIGLRTKILRETDFSEVKNPMEYCKGISGDIYLKGNWGNESWFSVVSEEIKKMYTFQEPLSGQAQSIYEEIRACPGAVTMHIRRGDYVDIGIALKPDYYIHAMGEMVKRVDNPEFYCFSEDLEWAKEAFKEAPFSIHYPEYQSEDKGVEDFRLLTAGKHQIISNSSYSWWVASLNSNPGKQVVIPCRENSIWNHEFRVEGWIPLNFSMNGKQKGQTNEG